MPFRRLPRPALALVIVLLAAPAAAPISHPRIVALSPVPEISVSEKDGTITGWVSDTGHLLWERSQADGLPSGIFVGGEEPVEWQEPGRQKAAAFAGHHLAIETRFESGNPHYPGDRRRITVIDALTGLPTWSILSGYPADGRARPFFYLVGAAAGKIIIDIPALRTIRALDLRDGTPLWEAALPGDCVSTALPSAEPRAADGDLVQSYSRADDRIVVAVTRCADRHTSLTGLDPATGRVRWEHRLPPAGPVELSLEEPDACALLPRRARLALRHRRVHAHPDHRTP